MAGESDKGTGVKGDVDTRGAACSHVAGNSSVEDVCALFGRLLHRTAEDVRAAQTDVALLDGVAAKFPWFTTARLMRFDAGSPADRLLGMHIQAYPRPARFVIPLEELTGGMDSAVRDPDIIIEKFLRGGEHRIVPGDATGEDDAAAESSTLDIPDEMVSEELAAIYLAQGLKSEAKAIYETLILLNPEKSVYFASIIADITGVNNKT